MDVDLMSVWLENKIALFCTSVQFHKKRLPDVFSSAVVLWNTIIVAHAV